MPKLVGDATGDEFFVLDDQRAWLSEVPGPTFLAMSVDSPHSLTTALPALLPTVAGFVHRVAWAAGGANASASGPRTAGANDVSAMARGEVAAAAAVPTSGAPALSWTTDYETGTIVATVLCGSGGGGSGDDGEGEVVDDCALPRTVRLWTAGTCLGQAPRRDFRLLNLDSSTLAAQGGCSLCGGAVDEAHCANLKAGLWRNATLEPDWARDPAGNTYAARVEVPPVAAGGAPQAWTAFFVAATFHGAAPGMPPPAKWAAGAASAAAEGAKEAEGGQEDCGAHPLSRRRFCLPVTLVGDMTVTTTIAVLPDVLPYACEGESCAGTLV